MESLIITTNTKDFESFGAVIDECLLRNNNNNNNGNEKGTDGFEMVDLSVCDGFVRSGREIEAKLVADIDHLKIQGRESRLKIAAEHDFQRIQRMRDLGKRMKELEEILIEQDSKSAVILDTYKKQSLNLEKLINAREYFQARILFDKYNENIQELALLYLTFKDPSSSGIANQVKLRICELYSLNVDTLSTKCSNVLKILQYPKTGSRELNDSKENLLMLNEIVEEVIIYQFSFILSCSGDELKEFISSSSSSSTDTSNNNNNAGEIVGNLDVVKFLVKPMIQRFQFNFSGDRSTNRIDKPEWLVSFVILLLRDNHRFISEEFQSMVTNALQNKAKLPFPAYVDILAHMIRELVRCVHRHLQANIDELLDDSALICQYMDELLVGDRILIQEFLYINDSHSWPLFSSYFLEAGDSEEEEKRVDAWFKADLRFAKMKLNEIINVPSAWSWNVEPTSIECANEFLNILDSLGDRISLSYSAKNVLIRKKFVRMVHKVLIEEFSTKCRDKILQGMGSQIRSSSSQLSKMKSRNRTTKNHHSSSIVASATITTTAAADDDDNYDGSVISDFKRKNSRYAALNALNTCEDAIIARANLPYYQDLDELSHVIPMNDLKEPETMMIGGTGLLRGLGVHTAVSKVFSTGKETLKKHLSSSGTNNNTVLDSMIESKNTNKGEIFADSINSLRKSQIRGISDISDEIVSKFETLFLNYIRNPQNSRVLLKSLSDHRNIEITPEILEPLGFLKDQFQDLVRFLDHRVLQSIGKICAERIGEQVLTDVIRQRFTASGILQVSEDCHALFSVFSILSSSDSSSSSSPETYYPTFRLITSELQTKIPTVGLF